MLSCNGNVGLKKRAEWTATSKRLMGERRTVPEMSADLGVQAMRRLLMQKPNGRGFGLAGRLSMGWMPCVATHGLVQ